MAKKSLTQKIAEFVAPPPPAGPAVLVFRAHGEDDAVIAEWTPVDVAAGEKYEDKRPEVHIGGVAYVHVYDALDGTWVYAPRDVKLR